MSLFADLGPGQSVLVLALAGGLLGLLLWLSWRRPTLVFLVALAALAIRPQLLWGGPAVGYAWGLQQSLLLFALAINALRYGVRRTINWPVLALVLVLALNLALGNLHPKLTFAFMLESLAILALPFVFTQVVLAPGSRPACALVIMLMPLVCTGLGLGLDALEIHPMPALGWGGGRLEGALGNAAVFATLAFAGLVVALHEATRRARWYAALLAAVNFALVVLSVTRMAVLASLVFVLAYILLSEELRAQWRAHRAQALAGLGVALGALVLWWPSLEARMFAGGDGAVRLSGRENLWPFYYQEFLLSPVVGRGLGAGFIAADDWMPGGLTAPHDEYLHLLVIGGAVGFVLIAGAIVLWYWQLLRLAAPAERPLLLALAPAVALYSITDNLSFYTSALPIYAYLGVLLSHSSVAAPLRRGRARATPAGTVPESDRLAAERLRAAFARMRAKSEALERITSRRSR